jgi:hypothetical protein
MSAPVTHVNDGPGAISGLPGATDLADVWLGHGLVCLLDACGVPRASRADLLESGVDTPASGLPAPRPAGDEEVSLPGGVDACRRAVVFAALALEARLNRVLARCDPEERQALGHLAPAEKFRLAPRLLDELKYAPEDAALCELVVEVFKARDELVEADGAPEGLPSEPSSRLSPSRARAIVEESAKICCFLATLTDEVPVDTAQQVWRTAGALQGRADSLSAGNPPSLPRWDWEWLDEFPPNLIGS